MLLEDEKRENDFSSYFLKNVDEIEEERLRREIRELLNTFFKSVKKGEVNKLWNIYNLLMNKLKELNVNSEYKDTISKSLKNIIKAEEMFTTSHLLFDKVLDEEEIIEFKFSLLINKAYRELENDNIEESNESYEMAEGYLLFFEPNSIEKTKLEKLRIEILNKRLSISEKIFKLLTDIEKYKKEKDINNAKKTLEELKDLFSKAKYLENYEELKIKLNDLINDVENAEEENMSLSQSNNKYISINLTDEEKKRFKEQKSAFESEINKIKQMIEKNEKLIKDADIDIHNYGINTLEKKFDIRYTATMFSTVVPMILTIILMALNVPITSNMILFSTIPSVLCANIGATDLIIKNKKKLLKDYKVSKEMDIQDYRLEKEIEKEVLIKRNKLLKELLNNLELKYNNLKIKGVPLDIKHELNNEDEMNTINSLGTRTIKKNIYSLEAELESTLRKIDKCNVIDVLSEIDKKTPRFLDFQKVFEYGFTPVLIFIGFLFMFSLNGVVPSISFLAMISCGLGSIFVKQGFLRGKLRALKRKIKNLGLIMIGKKVFNQDNIELSETSREEYKRQIEKLENEILKENMELKYAERKKKESIVKHENNLFKEEKIETEELGGTLALKMK